MAIRVALHHQTQYQYDRLVILSPHLIRLKPAAHTQAFIEAYTLTIEPENHILHWQQDPFGNFLARVDFTGFVKEVTIKVEIIARLESVNPFDFFIDPYAASYPFDYEPQLKKDLAIYLETLDQGREVNHWFSQIDRSPKGLIDFLVDLNRQVFQAIQYTERLQPGVQTAEETLVRAIGSCRDTGWLLVQLLRHLGLAARFVSGYLAQVSRDDTVSQDSPDFVPDSLALHAWAEVYIPGAGWIGLDPTSGMMATEGHIPLACTPDPASAAPVSGTSDPSETILTYSNTLTRLS